MVELGPLRRSVFSIFRDSYVAVVICTGEPFVSLCLRKGVVLTCFLLSSRPVSLNVEPCFVVIRVWSRTGPYLQCFLVLDLCFHKFGLFEVVALHLLFLQIKCAGVKKNANVEAASDFCLEQHGRATGPIKKALGYVKRNARGLEPGAEVLISQGKA